MAELVLSALLPVLFEKLASTTLKSIARYNGTDAEIKKWKRALTQIQGVLTDASHKEITSPPVKRWLNDLQHLAYDIDDILDGWLAEAMHRESTQISKVRKLIPTCCTNFPQSSSTMHDKLDIITTKLQDLLEEKTALGLSVNEESRSKNKNRRLQTSMVHASSIVGRQAETEALVQKLLGDEPCDQNFSVVPILGMGGVGKTTLARLLYDEKQVSDYFQLKAWVCVSDEFDSFAISKVIFQSVTGENKDFADLNLLQVALRDQLREKIFLLVLDDVWSESYEDWETLVGPFHACAPGSKIIMTTRKDQLLRKLGCDHLNRLGSLSREDALSLIAKNALGVDNFDSHLSLKPHAIGIVKKCDGLPLALKALGRLLCTKKDEEYWKKVLDSEIWKQPVEDEIVPALKLSYHDLSARLKQLFAYCSLFPKDCLFEKEELVLLWMGEGFLHQPHSGKSTEESMGHEYFDELLSRSFFQQAPNSESLFVMHDMMNDLATHVASEFFVRLDNEKAKDTRKEMVEKYRHMSFVRERYVAYKKFEAFQGAKSMRTFMATSVGVVHSWECFYLSNKILADLLLELPLLRVICLSNFKISEVPASIGTLKHLRYLNLSRSEITYLPETICNLYNLETLIVHGCTKLAKLPNNFLKLKNLRHIDIRDTPGLDKMPLGISEMKSLQTLSKIIIGCESGFEITKLKDFQNLGGKISIVGLEKVRNAIDAHKANFSQKKFSELEVAWGDVWDGSRNEMLEKEVLDELKPCDDKLIQLRIRAYGGLEFPKWVGDPSFLRLKHVSIHGSSKCTSLPPLGQLPSLKELFIEDMNGLKVVGMELLGSGLRFPSLEILCFKHMRGWEKWLMNSEFVFPCLRQLHIEDCPNLVEISLEALPSLNILRIIRCDCCVLRKLVQVASTITKLEMEYIYGLNDVVWRCVIEHLRAVEELRICGCNEIRYLWESEAVASKVLVDLKTLHLMHCDNLVNLTEKEVDNGRSNFLTSLRMLDVSFCNNMERFSCPDGIETLKVVCCHSLTAISLSTGRQRLKSLEISLCEKLLEREWGEQKMKNTRLLEHVWIECWPNLKVITELNYLVHLTSLIIVDCESLELFPDNVLSNMTSLKSLLIEKCPRMDACIPHGAWPPNLCSLGLGKLKKPVLEWGPQHFPTSLVRLSLYSDDGVSSCSQLSHLLPSSLTYLHLGNFERLESVSMGLQHLTSLEHLSFSDCPNLKKVSYPRHLTSLQHLSFDICPNMVDLREMLLPSLLSLRIYECPILKERYSKSGSDWPLISHIPYIFIFSYHQS